MQTDIVAIRTSEKKEFFDFELHPTNSGEGIYEGRVAASTLDEAFGVIEREFENYIENGQCGLVISSKGGDLRSLQHCHFLLPGMAKPIRLSDHGLGVQLLAAARTPTRS